MIKTIETIAQLGVVLVVWYLLHYLLKVFNVALEDDTNVSKEKPKNVWNNSSMGYFVCILVWITHILAKSVKVALKGSDKNN